MAKLSKTSSPLPITILLIFFLYASHYSTNAADQTLIDRARAEAQRNFSSFADLTCRVTSYRKVYKLDGELHRDNVVVKKLYLKRPDKKKEVFVSGTMNGQPAAESDFLWEKFGLASSTDFFEIECFRPGLESQFQLAEAGNADIDGRQLRSIQFTSLAPKKTNLQHGRLLLPLNSCRVARMEGLFVHRTIQRNVVDFVADFIEVRPDTWLPREIRIKGEVALGPLKRRIDVRNVFADTVFDVGLPDSFFE